MKIVLIEDEADIARVMVALLEREGHAVTWKSGTVSGVQAVVREVPDLVLTDIRLAKQHNGIGVAAILKRDPRTDHIPVVAVTGYATIEDTARYREMGFAGVIPKPFDAQTFAQRVVEYAAGPDTP